MSDMNLPEGFKPISPDSDFGKMLEKAKNIDWPSMVPAPIDYNYINQQMEEQNRETNAMLQELAEKRERKEVAEEEYRQETIKSLQAIEQNTANLYTLVDLISKNNEQQDELIELVTDILTIAKAKDKKEADSTYKRVMGKITQTVKDVDSIAKLAGWTTTVYNMVMPIIGSLNGNGGSR